MKLAPEPLLSLQQLSPRPRKPSNSVFAASLFSYSYGLLFPQLLSFDNHLNCPGVVVYPLCPPCSDLRARFVVLLSRFCCCFSNLQPLGRSGLSFSSSRPLFSIACSLFSQNARGWGIPHDSAGHPGRALPSLRTSALSAPRRYLYAFRALPSAACTPSRLSTVDCRLPFHNAKIQTTPL